MPRTKLLPVFSCLMLLAMMSSSPAQPDNPTERISFNRDIRPILSDNCFQCHGPDEHSRVTELRLDSRSSTMGDLGGYQAVVPGNIQQSELIDRINSHDSDEKMPPADSGKRLSTEEIQTLTTWIQQGAAWPEFWAYQPFQKHPIPKPAMQWGNGWIDSLVLQRLTVSQLKPSPRADRTTLIRRLYFDLTGLPPTLQQTRVFLQDESDDAYQKVVEQLLSSPHFGERMAMYWLDLVRFADTVGYHGDQDHNIAPYRSWVIEAFNKNMRFDQFTREQLAGDLLPQPTLQQRIATGYNRLLQTTHEGGLQPKEYRAIYAADRVRNVSAVWMGGTLGCAQCHDHKYDPYTSKDFYSMAAFFADIDDEQHFKVGTNALPTKRPPELLVIGAEDRQKLDELSEQIALAEKRRKPLDKKVKTLEGEDLEAAKQQLAKITARIQKLKTDKKQTESLGQWTMVTQGLPTPRVSRILPRGNWLDETGPVVLPAVPEFMESINVERRATRLDLANWLTNSEQVSGKLTARVLANRIWFLLMGSGVSSSLDDFGGQGKPPSNPELLDNLAWELIENGWDLKQLIREIVTSETYRQSSIETDLLREKDPYNQLFGRQDRYRLSAEMVRDSALSVSGLLNLQAVGGKSIKPFQPEGYYQHLNFPARKYKRNVDQQQWRRGLYIHWQRQFLHPTMKSLDAPSREECTAQRPRSNTPLAALALLNDPSFLTAAQVFAETIMRQSGGDTRVGLVFAFETATSRQPDEEEIKILQQLFQTSLTEFQSDPEATKNVMSSALLEQPLTSTDAPTLAAWIAVARALLNLDETITRN
ncbi:MAG: PSD1 and planctomycete cytochrome C domain-containing protein [Mariniblastus sp.]|nr:PSD1 and planctomycete cytochrome C domain-containing protein [Mariniblastus sp.]